MTLENHIQKVQNSLFELDCPLAVHVIEEELLEPELKYQILEWLFEKYKLINNETLDISTSPTTTTTTKKTTTSSSRLSSPTSPYSSSLDLRRKRESSPITKKKVNPLEAKITNLVNNCAILGCCNMKDASLFTEKGINSPVLNIFENLIEMINISIYFDNLESNEENTIENPLKYPRTGVKDIKDEISKDVKFLNDLCNSKNLSVLSNKSCGNILSKDLAALVNVEKNDNKNKSTGASLKQTKIDLEPLTEEIEKLNQEIENLKHEHDIFRAQYKYADQDEDDNTQVLHSLYTLSQHLATYIESFNLRFPIEIESWIYANPNTNDQVYSEELGIVISRITELMKNYHQMIDNIDNIRHGYEQLVSKPTSTIPSTPPTKKESLEPFTPNTDNLLSPMTPTVVSPISPFSSSYSLYQSQENPTLSPSTNQLSKVTLGGRINIDSEIKEMQRMENELQRSIDILVKSQERRIKYNPNLMQIELEPLSQPSPLNLSPSSSLDTPVPSKTQSPPNITKLTSDTNTTLNNDEQKDESVIIIEDPMDIEQK